MEFDNNEYLQYRIQRSYETITEAENALNIGHLHLASNRIYYAIFYIVSALALKHGFSTSKHQQLLGWFNKNFVKNQIIPVSLGATYMKAYKNRQEGDYGDMVTFNKEEIRELYNEMVIFVEEINQIINK